MPEFFILQIMKKTLDEDVRTGYNLYTTKTCTYRQC
ncbi:hypothetical protein CLOTH_14640 [Alkalithermobacter paradoxus]|uniref:Uncharacterized protein n=1 Tax=Alkalithermobacter paradoxus TaxID=29349 RepID=A0A1V4I610_9FIRM|nr:hypothetical protein CLOTH_14640 [[Clostridium] thermoalcaliphilum]